MWLRALTWTLTFAISSTADSSQETFIELSIPGALTGCRGMTQQPATYLTQCLLRWMDQRPSLPGLVRFNAADEAGGCMFADWCDQLSPNQTDAMSTFLPTSRIVTSRIVLFAVKSGSLVKALDSFLTPSNCNHSLMLAPVPGPPPFDLWRSCWLDRLPDLMRFLPRKTISVEILKDNVTVLKINFDASQSNLNSQNWFSQSRLLGSEPDLAMAGRTYNIFSIFGQSSASGSIYNRTFQVNTLYHTCNDDTGILAVVERSDDVCVWARSGALPRILFTTNAGAWASNAALADFMLITAA